MKIKTIIFPKLKKDFTMNWANCYAWPYALAELEKIVRGGINIFLINK
jgi:hypothetical protein